MLDFGFYNMDCMIGLDLIDDNSIDLFLTDIPYDGVNKSEKIRIGTPIRKTGKGKADVITFDLKMFLEKAYQKTKGTMVIFCGINQVSEIFNFFSDKQVLGGGTPRQLIWHKTNPSPMNGEYVYLSATENAVVFRKHGATFNARCKHNVLEFPTGSSEMHPTEKNHSLLADIIADNSNENDLIVDACAGSGSTLLMAHKMNRKFIGFELDENYYKLAKKRLDAEMAQMTIFDLGFNPYQE